MVEMIREGGDQTLLLVIDKEMDNMYRLGSFSPISPLSKSRTVQCFCPALTPASLEVSNPDTTEEVGD